MARPIGLKPEARRAERGGVVGEGVFPSPPAIIWNRCLLCNCQSTYLLFLWKVSSGWHVNYINYSNTTKNNILFIDVSALHRKPSSGLTSGAGRQYVKACPIRGSTGSSPRLDSCCRSSWSILPPLWVYQLCLILDQSHIPTNLHVFPRWTWFHQFLLGFLPPLVREENLLG